MKEDTLLRMGKHALAMQDFLAVDFARSGKNEKVPLGNWSDVLESTFNDFFSR